MKILHTEWSLGWGGQEIRIISEMEAFRERGYEMVLAARKQSRIYEEAKKRGFDTHDINFGFALNPVTLFNLARLAKKINAEIIHTHSSKDSWIGGIVGKLTGIPVIRSRHLSSTIKKKFTNTLVYRSFPSIIISSGRHIVEHLVNDIGCDPAKMVSVPAGADHNRFAPKPEQRKILRSELGLAEDTLLVGMVAVLRSWKGHHILLDAVKNLFNKNLDFHVVIAGDGPRRDTLRNMAKEMGISDRVHFLGHRKDVEDIFPAFDINVLPSIKNEATSQVVPQAMLCQVSNIVSDAGGLTEVIIDGENGLVVPADNATALADAIEKLLQDDSLRNQFAVNGREDALGRLTFEQHIDRTGEAYRMATH